MEELNMAEARRLDNLMAGMFGLLHEFVEKFFCPYHRWEMAPRYRMEVVLGETLEPPTLVVTATFSNGKYVCFSWDLSESEVAIEFLQIGEGYFYVIKNDVTSMSQICSNCLRKKAIAAVNDGYEFLTPAEQFPDWYEESCPAANVVNHLHFPSGKMQA